MQSATRQLSRENQTGEVSKKLRAVQDVAPGLQFALDPPVTI